MVQISDEELIEQLHKCEEENGYVSGSLLNNPDNNYPTQPTYSNRLGNLRDVCKSEGIKYGKESMWSKEKIIDEADDFFEENGELGVRHFSSTDNYLPSANTLYKYFDDIESLFAEMDNFEDVIESKKRRRRAINKLIDNTKYNENDKQALINHLWWVMKEYGNTKSATVNSVDGPSTQVYRDIFGSIVKAREEAGLDSIYNKSFEDRIGELPDSYDERADGYVYCIKMQKGREQYYYVGKSRSLRNRLNSHSSGSTKIALHHENKYGTINDIGLTPVCIVRIDNYYRNDDETIEEFDKRLESKEHVISYQIASAFNTDKVLGGK